MWHYIEDAKLEYVAMTVVQINKIVIIALIPWSSM